jgi:predicted nucleotide-binding protein
MMAPKNAAAASKKTRLPKLFIGSSSERRGIVRAFVEVLSPYVHCVPWYDAPEFSTKGSFTTFNALCDAAQVYDFALFIITADDALTCRRKKYKSPRDNVVFEMGLFIGNVGPERVLAVMQQTAKPPMKVPTDLLSVNMPRFQYSAGKPKASLASIKTEIQGFVSTLQKLRFRKRQMKLAYRWGFIRKGRNVEVKLSGSELLKARLIIEDHHLAIAARIEDRVVNFEDDAHVAYSSSRQLPDPLRDMVFQIPEAKLGRKIQKGVNIDGKIVMVSPP